MAVSEKGFLLVGKMPPRPGGWDRIVVERGPPGAASRAERPPARPSGSAGLLWPSRSELAPSP